MARKKRIYQEGDCFAVPLDGGGYAAGLIARADRTSTVLGYFFGPKSETIVLPSVVSNSTASEAILVRFFGNIGIQNGEWPIIGCISPWNRADWPMPMFGHIDSINPNVAFGRRYGENDLNQMVSEVRIPANEAKFLPEDGLSGHIALIIRLTRLLHEVPKDGWEFE